MAGAFVLGEAPAGEKSAGFAVPPPWWKAGRRSGFRNISRTGGSPAPGSALAGPEAARGAAGRKDLTFPQVEGIQ